MTIEKLLNLLIKAGLYPEITSPATGYLPDDFPERLIKCSEEHYNKQ